MVESTIRTVDPSVLLKNVCASRGKAVGGEPSLLFTSRGNSITLEASMPWRKRWSAGSREATPGRPNRVDALVWVLMELMVGEGTVEAACFGVDPPPRRSLITGMIREQERPGYWDSEPDPYARVERSGTSIWDAIDEGYWRIFGGY